MIEKLPPLNSLKAFESAQRHMSFQKAAEELYVTPAALSYQIKQLEDVLGVKLFERLNRAVILTKEGALIATGVEDGFSTLRRTMRKLKNRRSDNVLVISAGPAFTSKWLSPRVYRFLALYPEIDLRISSSLGLVDLRDQDVDVALRFGQGTYEGCLSYKLLDEFITPMCAPNMLEGDNALKQPKDLANVMLIHDETHIGLSQLAGWDTWLAKAGADDVVDANKGARFDIADNALNAAIAGAGVVLGRTVLASEDLLAGRLVQPFDLKLSSDFSFYAVVAEDQLNKRPIQKFLNWVVAEAKGEEIAKVPGPVT